MSATMISPHLPDLDLIASYAERQDTFFSRVSPWTKLVALVLVILYITVTRSIVICAGLFCAVLAIYALAGLPAEKLVAWYLLPVVFVISLVGVMAWSEPGIPLFAFSLAGAKVSLTDNGLLLLITLLLKALVSVTVSLFFLMTTRYEHFSAMIYLLFPAPLDQIFLMAYRFLFLTLAMTGSMLKAVRSRGGGIMRSVMQQAKLFAEVFSLVFIRSFERAERINKAMIARGYDGSYVALTEVPRPGISGIFILCAFALVIGLTVWLVPNTGGWL